MWQIPLSVDTEKHLVAKQHSVLLSTLVFRLSNVAAAAAVAAAVADVDVDVDVGIHNVVVF